RHPELFASSCSRHTSSNRDWSSDVFSSHLLDLILVPAKTDMLSGFYRVFGCARARAIELQTVVCATGAIGMPLAPVAVDTVLGRSEERRVGKECRSPCSWDLLKKSVRSQAL